jgi:hypothetical protein
MSHTRVYKDPIVLVIDFHHARLVASRSKESGDQSSAIPGGLSLLSAPAFQALELSSSMRLAERLACAL